MKSRELTKTLAALGWSTGSDEVGDTFAHFILPDRIIQIIYGIRQFPGDQRLEIMLSLSTELFSKYRKTIRTSRGTYVPLTVSSKGINIRAPEILKEHVRQASDEAIAWAQAQDLDKALKDLAALPTDAPGTGPVHHLAALALMGEVAKLKAYQASFEAGDRLGFVPYVTKDYIDRAVVLAEE